MTIVIAGGSGFLGQPLVQRCREAGHAVTLLSRGATGRSTDPDTRVVSWVPDGSIGTWAQAIDGADVVVNLAGESIAGARWTAAHKQRVLDSRVNATRSLAAAIAAADHPPGTFISGSAVGYYGARGDEIVTEETPPGRGFLAEVCVQWEAEALRAQSPRTRVIMLRTGLVIERDGGALPPMLPPFWLGVGGPVGSGRQYWPWIRRDDWIALVEFAMKTPALTGPVNATAPAPATNHEFAKALGRAMHRPALMPAPAFALKLVLGEMAEALILSGQRAVPKAAQALGFQFKYARLEHAFDNLF